MQEAWCRSWRQCVQTRPLHTRPPPLSGGAFGALLCRKEFLLNCSSHSPQITEWPWGPGPAAHGCCFRDFPWGRPCAAGQDLGPKRKDYCRPLTGRFSWFLISWKMLLLLVCWFVCFHFVEAFHPNFLSLTWQRGTDWLRLGNCPSFVFRRKPLDGCHQLCIPKEEWWEESEAPPLPPGRRPLFHGPARACLWAESLLASPAAERTAGWARGLENLPEQELCTHLKCLLGLLVMPQLCPS